MFWGMNSNLIHPTAKSNMVMLNYMYHNRTFSQQNKILKISIIFL